MREELAQSLGAWSRGNSVRNEKTPQVHLMREKSGAKPFIAPPTSFAN
jgi:hypothetical protein